MASEDMMTVSAMPTSHKGRTRQRRFMEKQQAVFGVARGIKIDSTIFMEASFSSERSGLELCASVPDILSGLHENRLVEETSVADAFTHLPPELSCERSCLNSITAHGEVPEGERSCPSSITTHGENLESAVNSVASRAVGGEDSSSAAMNSVSKQKRSGKENLVEQHSQAQKKYEKKLLAKLKDGDIDEETMHQMLQKKGRRLESENMDGICRKGTEVSEVIGNEANFSFLNADRGVRKRQQVENFFHILNYLLARVPGSCDCNKRLRVIDFGCGSGNLCLPIAWRFPEVDFLFVDRNKVSLDLVRRRADQADLTNVKILPWEFELHPERCMDNLHQFVQHIQRNNGDVPTLGIGLHCCGSLTDIVMETCRLIGSSCAVCPCCNGKVSREQGESFSSGNPLKYPRCDGLIEEKVYTDLICPMADYNAHASDMLTMTEPSQNLAKHIVEYDRAMWAKQHWDNVRLLRLRPATCSPKNLVILCFND